MFDYPRQYQKPQQYANFGQNPNYVNTNQNYKNNNNNQKTDQYNTCKSCTDVKNLPVLNYSPVHQTFTTAREIPPPLHNFPKCD